MPVEAMFDASNPVGSIGKSTILAQHELGNRLNVYTSMSGRQSYNFLPPPVLRPTFLVFV